MYKANITVRVIRDRFCNQKDLDLNPMCPPYWFWLSDLGFYFTLLISSVQSVQSLSHVQLFATPWIAARRASLSIINSWDLLKLMSIGLVMPSNHLILCCSLLLLPPIFPSIRVFSNELALRMRWPKYWSFSFSISPSNEHIVQFSIIPKSQITWICTHTHTHTHILWLQALICHIFLNNLAWL